MTREGVSTVSGADVMRRASLAACPAPRVIDSSAAKRSKSKKRSSMPKSEGRGDICGLASPSDSCSFSSIGEGDRVSVSEAASSGTVGISGDEVGGVEGGGDDFKEDESVSSHDNDGISSTLLAIVEAGPLDPKVESRAELPGSEYAK